MYGSEILWQRLQTDFEVGMPILGPFILSTQINVGSSNSNNNNNNNNSNNNNNNNNKKKWQKWMCFFFGGFAAPPKPHNFKGEK